MDIWHILTIILFTTQIVSGILCNGNTVEIKFFGKNVLGNYMEYHFI